MIVAHHGGEVPMLLAVLSGGVTLASVVLVVARERLGHLLRLRRRLARWRT